MHLRARVVTGVPSMFRSKLQLCLIVAFAVGLPGARLCADELTRQVQEELRRRHLYYNDIDGRNSQALSLALQRYQQRLGFAVTGTADPQTLRSLGILQDAAPPAEGDGSLPDEPVLRSDGLVPKVPHGTGAIAASNPGPITSKEVTAFVQRYLAACGSPSVDDEVNLYAERVDYYDHGAVDRQYVRNEIVAYDQRWPNRKYSLLSPVRISKTSGASVAKFRVGFEVANLSSSTNRRAAGRTDDSLGLGRRSDGSLEIVSLREQRVRRTSSHRRRDATPPLLRSVRRVFRSIFH